MDEKLRKLNSPTARKLTYGHLAHFLPCSKAALVNRAKKLYLQVAEKNIKVPLQRYENKLDFEYSFEYSTKLLREFSDTFSQKSSPLVKVSPCSQVKGDNWRCDANGYRTIWKRVPESCRGKVSWRRFINYFDSCAFVEAKSWRNFLNSQRELRRGFWSVHDCCIILIDFFYSFLSPHLYWDIYWYCG